MLNAQAYTRIGNHLEVNRIPLLDSSLERDYFALSTLPFCTVDVRLQRQWFQVFRLAMDLIS